MWRMNCWRHAPESLRRSHGETVRLPASASSRTAWTRSGVTRSKGELRARAFGLMAQDADRPVRAASWLGAVRYARRNRCKGGETGEHCQNVGRQIRLARAGLLGPHPGAGVLQAAVRLGNGSLQAR